ncbi:LacI family DNA-binding transcriptional regulator [Reinekea marinisedimentorum]|nr:LacI family DNA-binding transcriptional regulator [Reinekea marinisedimentorum]
MSLKQLSKQLGLSPSTVSRAMNDYPDISESTKLRVKEAAISMGYQANASARSLVTGMGKNIGLILPMSSKHRSSRFFDHLLSGATESLLEQNYLLSAIALPRDEQEVKRLRYLVDSRVLDAAILIRTRVNDERVELLLQRNIPFVCYGRTERSDEFAWLDMDNHKAMQLCVSHMIEAGHRNLAMINASGRLYFAKLRQQGFIKALSANQLQYTESRYTEIEISEDDGYLAANKLLKQNKHIDGIICANDTMAIGAIKACKDNNLVPGKDISVIGYNNSSTGRFVEPALTTVQHSDPILIGRLLGDMVYRRMTGENLKNLQKLMPPELIVRDS